MRHFEYGEEALGSDAPRVLVVDDEPAVRQVLVECLTLAGFEVLSAADAARAVRLVEHSLVPVELALVDLHLGGTSGLELVECLTRTRPGLPLILMSGSADIDPGDEVVLGRYPLLVKPFSLGTLITAVQAVIE